MNTVGVRKMMTALDEVVKVEAGEVERFAGFFVERDTTLDGMGIIIPCCCLNGFLDQWAL
jgi:hypothetical protein